MSPFVSVVEVAHGHDFLQKALDGVLVPVVLVLFVLQLVVSYLDFVSKVGRVGHSLRR